MEQKKLEEELVEEKVEQGIHDVFIVSLVLKGLSSITETILGILLLFTHVVTNTITFLLNYALIEDPDNFFAAHLHSLANLSPSTLFFGGLYLLSHGVIKCFLVGALFLKKPWAYPAAIAVLSLFTFYELVRFMQTGSFAILSLTLFDALVVFLIIHEYIRVRAHKTVL